MWCVCVSVGGRFSLKTMTTLGSHLVEILGQKQVRMSHSLMTFPAVTLLQVLVR